MMMFKRQMTAGGRGVTRAWLWTLLGGLLALSAPPALAVDPLILGGTEEAREDKSLRLFGFIQARADQHLGGEVGALSSAPLAPFSHTLPSFNRMGEAQTALWVPRARLGARGALKGLEEQVSYFVLIEAGQVPITRLSPIMPVDMSATLSFVPGARLRVGYFKLPTMEEINLPVPSALELVNFSNTLARLLNESTVSGGRYTSGVSAFRDLGAQVFDSFELGAWRLGYALMASNGGRDPREQRDAKDLSGRLELAYVWEGRRADLRQKELKLTAWRLQGARDVEVAGAGGAVVGEMGSERVSRVRQGASLRLERGAYWALVEYAEGRGALDVGGAYPFAGAPVSLVARGEAWGAVAQAGLRQPLSRFVEGGRGEVGVKARYEEYRQQTEEVARLRVFRTATLGLEWAPSRQARLQLDYELRSLEAPEGSPDARAITAAMGDRLSLQLTVMF